VHFRRGVASATLALLNVNRWNSAAYVQPLCPLQIDVGESLPLPCNMTASESRTPPLTAIDADQIKRLGRAVIEIEARTLAGLVGCIDDTFVEAAGHMLACPGRIVVLGMGKSGHIGSKFAATLASTGTPAFFVHPGEASHGDMGMITAQDVVFALSNSGETDELTILIPLLKRLGVPLIALTGNPRSTLAEAATVHLYVRVEQEACPLGLAPTSSTTAALAMGDALAVALLEARGFTQEDFARSHPGGALGRRLLLKIHDLMHRGEQMPVVTPGTRVVDALLEMTRKGLGLTAVTDTTGRVLGVFTDGDLRRALDRGAEVLHLPVGDVMTRRCKTVQVDMLAAEALRIMQDSKINALLVVDGSEALVGVLNMHDLLKAKVL
jgi:arabinose-5-phosphate isomerase